jgi:hypothetical protein
LAGSYLAENCPLTRLIKDPDAHTSGLKVNNSLSHGTAPGPVQPAVTQVLGWILALAGASLREAPYDGSRPGDMRRTSDGG